MPRDELDAFDRLYLDHGLVDDLGRLGHDARRRRRRWRDARQLDDLHRRARAPSARRGRRDHGLEGLTGRAWADDVAAIERELGVADVDRTSRRRTRSSCAARRRSAGRPPRPGATRRLRRLRVVRVRLPAGHQAVGHPGPPRARGRRAGRGSCPTRAVDARAARTGGDRVDGRRGRRSPVADGPRRLRRPGARTVVARRGRAADARRSCRRSGLDAPGDRPLPAPPPGAGPRRPLRRARRDVARHDAGRALARVRARRRRPAAERLRHRVRAGAPGAARPRAARGRGPTRTPRSWTTSRHLAPLIAVTRDGGEGRTTSHAGRTRPDRLPARRRRRRHHAPRAGLAWPGSPARPGRPSIVAVGTPPAWYRRGRASPPATRRRVRRASRPRSRRFDFGPNRGTVFSAHQMGTVRMGARPGDAPVRSVGPGPRRPTAATRRRAASTSATVRLFPTGIGVNPMITIMALARRRRADGPRGDLTPASRPRRRADARPRLSVAGRRPAASGRGRCIRPRAVTMRATAGDDDRAGDERPRRRSARCRTIAPRTTATTGLT